MCCFPIYFQAKMEAFFDKVATGACGTKDVKKTSIMKMLKQDVDAAVLKMFALIKHSEDPKVRSFCCQLLGSLMKEGIEEPLSQEKINEFVDMIKAEEDLLVRQYGCEAIHLIHNDMDEERKVVLSLLTTPNPKDLEIGLRVAGLIVDESEEICAACNFLIPNILGTQQQNGPLIGAATVAGSALLSYELMSGETPKHISLPLLMQGLAACLNHNDQKSFVDSLQILVDDVLVIASKKMLQPIIQPAAQMMGQVCMTESLPEDTRCMAFFFFNNMMEGHPTLLLKVPGFLESYLSLCLRVLLEKIQPKDEDEWEEEEEEDHGMVSSAAAESLDIIARFAPSSNVIPALFRPDMLPSYLDSEDWRHKCTAYLALTQMAEGCREAMSKEVEPIVAKVLAGVQSPHVRVRYMAIHCIGQMATDLSPVIEEKCHREILQALCAVLKTDKSIRVQSHAAAAITNLTEEMEAKDIEPFLQELLQLMIPCIQGPMRRSTEVVRAIAGVASGAKKSMLPFFVPLATSLLEMLVSVEKTKAGYEMRGAIVECLTCLCHGIGSNDVVIGMGDQIMQALKQMDDSEVDYGIKQMGFCRVGITLGTHFAPYLSDVVPVWIKKLEEDIKIVGRDDKSEGDDDDDEHDDDDDDDHHHHHHGGCGCGHGHDDDDDDELDVDLGKSRVRINQIQLQQRTTCMDALSLLFENLLSLMLPYVESAISVIGRGFYEASTPEMLCSILKCLEAALKEGKCSKDAVSVAYRLFVQLDLWQLEDARNLVIFLLSFSESMKLEKWPVFTSDEMVPILKLVMKVLREPREEGDDGEGANDEEEEEEEESDSDELCNAASEVFTGLVQRHREAIAPFARDLPLMLIQSIDSDKDLVGAQKFGLSCVVADVMEHIKVDNTGEILKALIPHTKHRLPPVRQGLVFTTGLCIESDKEQCRPHIPALMHALLHCINAFEDEGPNDNAVSAIGKALFHIAPQDFGDTRDKAIDKFLSGLPLKVDHTEMLVVRRYLKDLVVKEVLVAPGNTRWLPAVLLAVCRIWEAADADCEDDEEKTEKIAKCLEDLKVLLDHVKKFPPADLQAAYGQISESAKLQLQEILSAIPELKFQKLNVE